jgi:hypothetical protein
MTVIANGTLEFHVTAGTPDGTVTSSGTELTIEFFGTHCIFKTNSTDIGRLTGATTTGAEHATIDLGGNLPRTGGRSGAFCGSNLQLTGSYRITTPTNLNVH